jgi:hypothetical protein
MPCGPEEVGVYESGRSELAWFKSSYSGDKTECVELSVGRSRVLVRDSKRRQHDVLAFRHAAWCGFLAGLVNPDARDD